MNSVPTIDSFSDHAAILYKIKSESIVANKKQTIKGYASTNWHNFNKYVDKELQELKIPSTTNMNIHDIDETAYKIEEIFRLAVKKYVPEIEMYSETVNISKQSKALIRIKKTLLRRKHRNKNTPAFNNIICELRNVNNMIFNSISNDYRGFWKKKITKIKIDNNVFKQIKSLSTYKSKTNIPDTLKSNENKILSDDSEKCEAFANQFEKTHELTYNQTSKYEFQVNRTYDIYDKSEAILNFSNEVPADFKDKQINVETAQKKNLHQHN